MNTVLLFLRKYSGIFLLIAVMMSGGVAYGQVTIFSENMGTPSGTTAITSNIFQNTSPIVFAGSADVRTSTASAGYTGASGSGNVFITSANGVFFQISGINTSGYSSLSLSIGHFKSTTASNGSELVIEVSSDDITYTPLTYTRPTGSGTANWTIISPTGTIPSTANLRIRFRQTSTTPQFRIDDVKLIGTLIPSGFTSITSGAWDNPQTWNPSGTLLPGPTDNVTILDTHIVTVTSAITRDSGTTTTVNAGGTLATNVTYINNGITTINGTFQLNEGGFASGTTNFTYGTAGTLNFSKTSGTYQVADTHIYWPVASGPVNVNVLQSGLTLLIGANREVNGTFAVGGSGVLTPVEMVSGATLAINGICQINEGGFFNNAPLYGSSSILRYSTGNTYNRGLEWSALSGVGYPNNVQISTNTTLNYPSTGAGAFSTPLAIAKDLTIDSGSSLFMDFGGNNNKSGRLTVGGNVAVNGSLSLGNANGGDLYIGGNWNSTGTFFPNSRAVFFNGTVAQTITGVTTFDFLTINNTNIAGLTLNNSIVTNLTFDLATGKLTLGANDLSIGSGGTITNATAAKYIVTNGTGQLKRTVSSTSVVFPIGPSATFYNPVSATNTGASDVYGFRVATGVGGSVGSAFQINNSWYISEAIAGGSQLRVVPQWNVGDQGSSFGSSSNLIQLYPAATNYPATITGQTAALTNAGDSFGNSFTGVEYFVVGQLQSNTSDIITDTTFPYAQNIDYKAFVNSNITALNSVELARFIIRDGGASADADAFSTSLTSLSVNVGNSGFLQRIAIYDGTTEIAEVAAAAVINFTGLSLLAPDNGTKIFTIRASFNTSVTDNQRLTLVLNSVTASGTGSGFGTISASTSTAGDDNRIEVTADRLAFVQQPSSTTINVAMTPAVTVSANDANGNRDLDFTTPTTITSNGTLTGSLVSGVVSNGLITFSGVVHTVAQTGRQLTVATSGLAAFNTSLSTTFVVTDVANGTYRTTSNGTWPTAGTATWERLVSGSWTSGTPAANSTDLIIIKHAITTNGAFAAAGGVGTKMKIENGGTFNAGHNCTFGSLTIENGGKIVITNPAVDILATTGTVTVDSGGTVTINSGTLNLVDGFWDGIENFKNGSTLEILNWDWNDTGANERLIGSAETISTNANGYYFGNIIFSGAPSGKSFTFVGLTGTHKLCENNLTINNNTAFENAILTNLNANVEIGGDVIVNTNKFSFGAVSASTITHTVKGNITGNGGIIDLNQNSSGSATVFVNVAGNVTTAASASLNSTDGGCKIVFSKAGTQTVSLAGTLGTNVAFEVAETSTTRLINQNVTLTNASNKFTVLDLGILEFNGFDILGFGDFIHLSSGTLRITSVDGVNVTSATGNVKNTGTRTFSQAGVYHYVGNITPQNTGTAMTSGSTSKRIIIDKTNATDVVNLTQTTGTTNELYIAKGVFVETETANIFGSGSLTMDTDGKYNTSVTSATVPRLSGTFTLNGSSTLELNATGNQELRGSRSYRNLTFSTSGIKTISSAISSITGTITVANAAVLSVDNKTMGGSGTNLTMTGTSEYITAGTGVKPDASGTYSLGTGTKVTFTSGSTAVPVTTLQSIRLAPNYYNIDIVGNNVGTDTESGIKIQIGGTFSVKPTGTFKFTNSAGFSGQATTAVANANAPTIVLSAGSTVEYAKAGIQTITSQASIVENTTDPGDDDSHYSNLKLSGSGTKSFLGSSLKIGNDLAVENTALLKIESGKTIIVNNKVTAIDSDNTKGIIIKDSGSLVQIASVLNASGNLNAGSIRMERITQPVLRLDYTYWSSPVFENGNETWDDAAGEFKFLDLSPTTPLARFYKWNPAATTISGWTSVQPATSSMVPGKGYIVQAPADFSTTIATAYTANFIGKPNNGTINAAVIGAPDPSPLPANTYYNWNLLGNPYPSALSAEAFLDANSDGSSNNILGGTLYFWTHNTPNTNGAYTTDDYAAWNSTGGVGTGGTGVSAPSDTVTPNTPTGYIAAGQSFFVKGLANGNALFNNSMRVAALVGTNNNNNQFFKSSMLSTNESQTTGVKSRVWLNLFNGLQAFSQTLVGYIPNATNGYDVRFDGESFGGNGVTFYSVLDAKRVVIQGRALPFVNTDTVPLGYRTTLTGNLTIGIDRVDGLLEDQDIYLQDNVLNVVHDLNAADYTFAAVPGTFNSRFVLRYLPQENLSNPGFEAQIKAVTVYKNEGLLHVHSPYETIATVAVYDITGRLIFERKNCNTNRFETNDLFANEQALIVKVTLANGGVVTEKVL